ncbi:hypothetical protein ASE21_16350 [Flavobacterium sp. Root901]|uniref:contractile injection system tape measure protein n=1 Tax=Flavobacterium sp. Root901 TaxID=1736605 RepID=UPI00070A2F9A|nr:contractile injection system tape measure protein [Flavobacterium sp. Root901]KRD08258.1 hypothetical protein ASE21_16350 [Flavobacterium sp. Root901]
MLSSSKHIINKVFLEINTNSKEKGYYLKDNIDAFLQKEIFSFLENYFNELDSKNPSYSIQLEKLNIDIAINQNLDFEDFKEQILKKITKQVEEVFEKEDSNTEGYKRIRPQEKEIESFFHFLETGTNTWWTTSNHDFKIIDDTTFDEVLNDESFSFKWKNAVQKPMARTRFIKQFSDSQIATIIKKGILVKKNNIDSSKIIRIETIKKQIEISISKNQLITNQRFLTWEIVILNLLGTSDAIVKQKLSGLICSVFKFQKKNSFFENKKLFLKEIENQIENQNELELLANLDAVVLIIEKKLAKVILKEKEKGTQTFPKKQEEIKNETEKETGQIKDNNEKTTSDPDLILLKSKENTVDRDDKNIESASNDLKEKTSNKNEKVIDKKDDLFEKEEDIRDPDISGLYVDNAGLVLIHPFLKSLFENCRLLNKDNTINNPETAAHLLHYIATGKEQDYENAMAFEKFLCNIPIDQPIERNIVLSEEMKKEGAAMLQAVLSNWDAMKTSSAELLENEFLQRTGKLNINGDENPTVIIERKTQDILLDKLSWNLSIIKLAWKKRIIYVNW